MTGGWVPRTTVVGRGFTRPFDSCVPAACGGRNGGGNEVFGIG